MDDIKMRFKSDDNTVRTRCMQKLLSAVKKKTKGEKVTSSSVAIPELNLIWDTFMSGNIAASNLAMQGIISLVSNNYVDFNYAINKFLSTVTSASNAYALVKGICALVMFQYKAMSESNKALNYSLFCPKHPLIEVLEKNEDYLPLILENIADVISEDNYRGFQIMEPVICYMLSNPVQRRSRYSKILVLETLIDVVKSEPKTAFYMLRFVPFLQVENLDQVAETSNFVQKAKRIFESFDCDENDRIYISELLLLSSLSLCEKSLTFGYDPTRLLDLAKNLSQSLTEFNYNSSNANVCLVLVSVMLTSTSGVLLEKLVAVALVLLELRPISPTIAAFAAFSVIQILPDLNINFTCDSKKASFSQLLEKLESHFQLPQESAMVDQLPAECEDDCEAPSTSDEKNKMRNMNYIETFTSSLKSCSDCVKFALKLDVSTMHIKSLWLKSIRDHVTCSNKENLDVIFSLVAALFLMSPDNESYIRLCLDTFEAILLKNTNLATRIFALLLYKQNLLMSPQLKILILEFLPKSAVHKFSIPPVVSILTVMSNEPELKALSVFLMLQLWKKQDRCFSYLHKQLVERSNVISSDTGVNEILISQAAAIKEICVIAPEKHGSEFLKTLSEMFNESSDDSSSPVACLALDGIISLCKSEFLDIRPTWKALAPKLNRDKRTLVTCRMYKLLALAPGLQVKSAEYDKFMSEIATGIWKQVASGMNSSLTLSAAYEALSEFPFEYHTLKLLPSSAKENLKLPASYKSTPFEMSKLPEDVLSYVPGYCFIDFLKSMDDDIVIKGYTVFMHSLVKQEVSNLPRSIYSQKRHVVKQGNISEVLAKVPAFLCSQFGMGKPPALQKNLAVGVLLSYESPVEMDKDGQPIKRSMAAQSRLYEQVLSALLNEVNVDTSEWHRCILLPSAWAAFMERALFTCEESRRADMELQYNHGHLKLSPEDFNIQLKSAWLWVRDRLLNVIKTTASNAPTSHANAVYAVSGLISAADKFYSSLDESTKSLCGECEKFTSHSVFQADYAETLLCSVMNNYIPSGKVHSWLLTHLSREKSSTSYLVRGCSSASISLLVPVLTTTFADEIPKICKNLLQNLSHSSVVLSFYSNIGLALFLKSLCETGYTDNGESQANLVFNSVKEMHRIYAAGENSASLIGLTIAMTSLSQIMQEEFKDWISATCNLFHEKLMEEDVSSMNFEVLSICVSAMMIGAADGNCISIQEVKNLASWFDEKRSGSPQCSGISVSSGMLMEALERCCSAQGSEMKQKLQKEWFNSLASEKKPTLQRIAALNGLCALYSCGRGLMQIKKRSETGNTSALNDLIPLMFKMLNATRDIGLQNICSWEIGRLFSVNCSQQEVEASASSSYSYLEDKSILKPMMNVILDGHKNDESSSRRSHLLACLKTLAESYPRPLPPLNWVTVLTPFFQADEDPIVMELALKIAVHQASSSPFAANLVSSYCTPPLVHALPENGLLILLKNIPALTMAMPPAKLQLFLHAVVSSTIKQEDKFQSLGKVLMQGIKEAFKLSGCKQQSQKVLQGAFISIFKHLKKDHTRFEEYLAWFADGMCHLTEESANGLLSVSKNTQDISILTKMLCHLVKTGKKQLSCLRPCVEEGKHSSQKDKEEICGSLYECFLTSNHQNESEVNQPEKCISWLLETIGWIKVFSESKSKYQLLTFNEVFIFLVDVCLATIIGCAGLESSYDFLPIQNLSHRSLLEKLPTAITKLAAKEEWSKAVDKIIVWQISLLQSEYLNEMEKYYIKLSLCAMRDSSEFQKAEVWTEVIRRVIQ